MSEALPEPFEAPQEPAANSAAPEVEYAQIPAEQWQQTQEMLSAMAPLYEAYQQQQQAYGMQQQPQQQPTEIDPFSDNFTQQLDQYIDQRLAPVTSYTQEQQLSEASEQAMDILNDHVSSQGYTFLNEGSSERALELANHYVAEYEAQYGQGMKAAESAIARAADEIRDWEKAVGEKYAQQQQEQLQTITNAPRQLGQTAVPSTQNTAIPAGDERAVLSKYYNR